MHVLTLAVPMLDVFARGGGGGSGGGGGGGGGGIAMLGYLPAHFVTSWFSKHVSDPAAYVSGIITAVVVTVVAAYMSAGLAILIAIGAGVGVYSGTHNWLGKLGKRMRKSEEQLKFAASTDPSWNEEHIQARVRGVFENFQYDWSTFNLQNMRTYTTARYYQHMELMLIAMHQMHRSNLVANPVLTGANVVNVVDVANKDDDNFDVYIEARATDQLVDTTTNKIIYTDSKPFQELWHFDHENGQWMLNGIRQATENEYMRNEPLQRFADANGMFYSLDMGWLLLPQRGRLFGKANFKTSDVNNHVIGNWHGNIVQLYTYIPLKANESTNNYLVGQINLPKSYGGIIIKRKSTFSWLSRAPRGYQAVSFEWPDFNKRYQVYATDMDKVTSFELLNPAVMADLYDRNLKVDIEVVDNVVYMYAKVSKADAKYQDMLAILLRAFQELKI